MKKQFLILATVATVFSFVHASSQHDPGPTANDLRQKALQSCPTVEEEILDLEWLADGLRNSRAIGLWDKIRLKSSIDELLERMEEFHEGKRVYSLPELQEQYDVLLMKIATHLQHKDVALHGQLCNAWEVLWLDLESPEIFAEKFL